MLQKKARFINSMPGQPVKISLLCLAAGEAIYLNPSLKILKPRLFPPVLMGALDSGCGKGFISDSDTWKIHFFKGIHPVGFFGLASKFHLHHLHRENLNSK